MEAAKKDFKGTPSSPGMKYRHYAPQTPLYLVEGEGADQRRKLADLNKKLAQEGYKVGLILFEESRDFYAAPVIKVLSSKKDPCLAAERLFAVLRSKDFLDVDVIAEGLEEKEIGRCMNCLRKQLQSHSSAPHTAIRRGN